MKTLALIGALVVFAWGATAHADTPSARDLECGNNHPCLHSPEVKDAGTIS
ncbi:hypothetical protein [Marinobacter sp. 1_MG-2023]|uniref:hypothetical protein n=1 Tax=Marinobacter sp. 1_MG-2023 TaxID=3062627 RepID=UPI0026E1C519|nr:hypothetical protein [Marinobacter sp. 1_MG-2023]